MTLLLKHPSYSLLLYFLFQNRDYFLDNPRIFEEFGETLCNSENSAEILKRLRHTNFSEIRGNFQHNCRLTLKKFDQKFTWLVVIIFIYGINYNDIGRTGHRWHHGLPHVHRIRRWRRRRLFNLKKKFESLIKLGSSEPVPDANFPVPE